jgi:hypothetical protein
LSAEPPATVDALLANVICHEQLGGVKHYERRAA